MITRTWIIVWKNHFRKTMMSRNILYKQFGILMCKKCLGLCNAVSQFAKSVNNCRNHIMMCRRHGKTSYNVHGLMLPRPRGNWQRHQITLGFPMQLFHMLTNASVMQTFSHSRPIGMLFTSRQGRCDSPKSHVGWHMHFLTC